MILPRRAERRRDVCARQLAMKREVLHRRKSMFTSTKRTGRCRFVKVSGPATRSPRCRVLDRVELSRCCPCRQVDETGRSTTGHWNHTWHRRTGQRSGRVGADRPRDRVWGEQKIGQTRKHGYTANRHPSAKSSMAVMPFPIFLH